MGWWGGEGRAGRGERKGDNMAVRCGAGGTAF